MTFSPRRRLPTSLVPLLLSYFSIASSSSFEPYSLNGGLVSAVAGKEYVVVASDTRMMDGGYEIYSRRYLTSRLWNVGGSNTDLDTICEADGSLRIPTTSETTASSVSLDGTTPPTWIASSGCAADCEALKRILRKEVSASLYWNTQLHANHISSLLSQTLYSRRGFPYYAFCVVAGFTNNSNEPACFTYDAIGSFEQVAVATAGTGRELLQPILDRLFSSSSSSADDDDEQPLGRIGIMPRVVETQVSCTVKETISRLIRGYKSVAERDIGVGDSVVLCVMERDACSSNEVKCRVLSVPLKTH